MGSWTPSTEKGVTGYAIAWGPPNAPFARTRLVTAARATLAPAVLPKGQLVECAVRAVTARGLHGWDWARTRVDK